jgi:ribonuclease R
MLLRSMMKAKYNEKCLGHYGLAMNYYCHFTSPIRRYPDLITHRIIKRLLLHPNNYENDLMHFEIILPEACLKNSASERKAIECERAVNDMLSAWYMSKYKDKFMEGTITSVTSFGMFVTLDNGIEGLVSLNNLIDYFDYDSYNMSYSNGKKTYKLGVKVTVVVIKADKKSRKIDFMFKDDYLELEGYNEDCLY